MLFEAGKTFRSILSLALIACTFAYPMCSVDVVMVRGRVDHAPDNALVRVQLVYARDVAADSGDVTVENGKFSIPIEFLTQSRRAVVNGLMEKCNRRPKTVIVTLVDRAQTHEYDRVSLDFAKDFKLADSTTYFTLRSELVLDGSH